uniref:Uncharacterized protein n=1 Tax=Rhizophora mucronata TaxID=61149 RepID=A0A2P2P6N4_RHIMU
MTMKGVENI